MPKKIFVFAVLLIALGVGAFLMSSSRTALLPAYVGGALAIVGALAMGLAGFRKYLLPVAGIVALLGALAPAAALAIRAAAMSPLALTVNVGMLALTATLFVLIVREFMAARRA
jgi:hypothetical protein